MKMITVENISVSFGNEKIFDDFSFSLIKGQKIAISGSSGMGKSTLLNVILGFVPIEKGVIYVNNIVHSSETIKQIRQNVAWLPQDLHLKLETVDDLLFLPFSFALNRNNKPSDNEVEKMLEELLLEKSILRKKLDEISGGQKQRVALASQLLLKKPLLLLDEPSSALDDVAQEAVLKIISQNKELSVLSVSHNNKWLEKMDEVINLTKKDI